MHSDQTAQIRQNLLDAGCDKAMASSILQALQNGNTAAGLQHMSRHRRALLEELHLAQKRIDCLDYLIYQLRKQTQPGA